MNDSIFIQKYADPRLMVWWKLATPAVRAQLLAFLKLAHGTPLAKADQYTVGLYTGQPDNWKGARLVFGVKDDLHIKGRAVGKSFLLSIPLRVQEPLDVTFVATLDPANSAGRERMSTTMEQFTKRIAQCGDVLERVLVDTLALRMVQGSVVHREAHWPSEYAIAL